MALQYVVGVIERLAENTPVLVQAFHVVDALEFLFEQSVAVIEGDACPGKGGKEEDEERKKDKEPRGFFILVFSIRNYAVYLEGGAWERTPYGNFRTRQRRFFR